MTEMKFAEGKMRATAAPEGNSRRRMVAGFLASVLGLVLGVGTGVPEGKALARRLFTLRATAIKSELSAFSATQFRHADSEHARKAVLAEIAMLQTLARVAPQLSGPQAATPSTLYLAYARLALVQQSAGDAAAAQRAQQEAQRYWGQLHPGSELSAEQMRQSVSEFDERIQTPR
jgi:hypothetical protein